jgi:hypothetical protein
MAVEVFHYDCIPRDALPPAMMFLLTKWNTLSVMDKLTLPAIAEGSSVNVFDNCAYMIPAGDDFYFVHMGKNVQAAVGLDHTGKLLSTINTVIARDLLDAYQQAVAQETPIFMRFTSATAQNALVWERLVLPIPVHRLGVILVCYSEVISHHQGVFEYMFQSARHPCLVTYPIFDGEQKLDDGWVLLMNDAARAAFSYEQPIGNLRLRELALFQFAQLWTQLRERYALANPRSTVALDRVELDLIKMNRLLGFRFSASAAQSGALA